MSEVKELNYFASDFPNMQKIVFKSVDDYHKVFTRAGEQHLAVGEASPFYLFSQVAFQKMAAYDPGAKVILILRHPVDFVESYHRLNISLLREDESDLAKAWDLQPLRERGQRIPAGARQADLLLYGEVGRFGKYVERLLTVFPREQVKVFLYDDLRANPRAVYEQTLDFIGVPSNGRVEFPRVNANFENRSTLLARLLHPPQPVYQFLMKVISPFGIRFMKQVSVVYNRIERLNRVHIARPSIEPALRHRLLAHFRADIEKLSALIGRDLSVWTVA